MFQDSDEASSTSDVGVLAAAGDALCVQSMFANVGTKDKYPFGTRGVRLTVTRPVGAVDPKRHNDKSGPHRSPPVPSLISLWFTQL